MLFFRFKNNEFIHDFVSNGVLGINIELMLDPIIVQLVKGIAKLSFNVTLGVRLFCGVNLLKISPCVIWINLM